MTEYRNLTAQSFRFRPDTESSEPFPPSYYQNEKRAKELYEQLHNPKILKAKQ